MWYTITKAVEDNRWSNKFGDFITYDVGLIGEDGVPCPSCQLNQKDTTPAPMVDGRIHGYIETTDRGLKFKKTEPEDGGSSVQHSGASKSSQGSTGYQQNPDTQNQIIRQSMVKAAVDICIANKKDNKEVDVSTVLMVAEQLVGYATSGRVGQANNEIEEHLAEQAFFDQEVK